LAINYLVSSYYGGVRDSGGKEREKKMREKNEREEKKLW
jgi:hypothetical protein